MLSIVSVRLTIKVTGGIPDSFKLERYPPPPPKKKKTGSSHLKVRANGHKNSQHFWANNVGNCCVRVGSGVKPEVYPFV